MSEVKLHVGGGGIWTGAIPNRDDDVFGIGVTWVNFSNEAGAGLSDDYELAIEIFYKLQLTPWTSVKQRKTWHR